MNAKKSISLLKKLLLSTAALLAFTACENFKEPGAYFDSYGNVAKITNVLYSRQPTERDGVYYIDSNEDFEVTYLVDNPGNFTLYNLYSYSNQYTVDVSKTYLKFTYPKNYLAQIDGDTNGLLSTIALFAYTPNGKPVPQEYYQGPKILCNSPPPKIKNALAQMYSVPSESINERLVIPMQLPLPTARYTYEYDGQTYTSYKYDYASLVVTDTRSGTVHDFAFEEYGSYIKNGTESNGWTIGYPGYFLTPTCPGGPNFYYDMLEGGPILYICTDVYDLTSIEPFKIKLFLRDKGGLEGEELEIPSRAVKLSAPTCSASTGALTNSLAAPYAEFTIYAPSEASDATLHYTITDSSGNPVADTSGSATEHVGDATFHLYPTIDGNAATYSISQAYATKTGYVDSDNAAYTFGSGGLITVTGVQLETPTADPAPASVASLPQGSEVTFTSPQNGTIVWIGPGGGSAVKEPSPVTVVLETAGANNFAVSAEKDYYKYSATANFSYNVTLARVYVQSGASDSNPGTKALPVGTISRAISILQTSGDPTSSANTICILGDMTSIDGLTDISSGYYNIVGCDASGTLGVPVTLTTSSGEGLLQLGGGTLSLRAVTLTGMNGASSGAVNYIGGTLILKDKVTITGNSNSGAAKNINIATAGLKIHVDAAGLAGTKVGVTSFETPAAGTSVTITDGYAAACGTEPLSGHFTSDSPSYSFVFDASGEAALATGGGSIAVGDIYSVAFAKTASAGVYTFTASATPTSGSSPVDITDDISAWSMKLYYLNTYTGMTSATNTMDLSALGEGTYIMKISAVYGGKTYSGEVEIVKGPVGLGTPLTLEAAVAGTVVTFVNNATGPVTYKVNGGTGGTITSGAAGTITLAAVGDKVQFYGDNAAYATDTTDGNCSNIACNKNCYVYGNIMSLIKSAGFESQKTLTGNYTFCKLFKGNAYIKNKTGADLLLPATTLKDCCYQAMFQNCASLTTVPELPATSVTYHGYYSMFQGCTSLTTAPNLPATSLAMASCCRMFQDCTSLASAPELPATTMKSNCYESMFQGCTSLVSAPELPATTLDYACYAHMFEGCTSLTTAPALPATTLSDTCYKSMFSGCTSLTSAPELPVETLAKQCYNSMFEGCTSLNSVTCLATDISASNCTSNWLKDVASSGTFTKAAAADWSSKTGADGIPSGWTVQNAP